MLLPIWHVAGTLSESWLSSAELQLWFGRLLVFIVILAIGGLLGWSISKIIRFSALSGTDRVFGVLFGFCRGIVLIAVCIIAGQFLGFDNDRWWLRSRLIPYGNYVADWIRVMAPKGIELLDPENEAKKIPIDIPDLRGSRN